SIVTYGAMVHKALEAAEELEESDVDVEVVDLRTIYPMDTETILESVAKTSRALVLYESNRFLGVRAELSAVIAEEGFESLDEPLFEISTDKVDTEVPSPVEGTISEIKVQEGETVSVGTELAVIDDGSAGQQKVEVSGETAEEPEEKSAEEAVAKEVAEQPEK